MLRQGTYPAHSQRQNSPIIQANCRCAAVYFRHNADFRQRRAIQACE
jgi:hypothetical protein